MNKLELINEMAKDLNSAHVAKAALDSLLNHISLSLKNHRPVKLSGFGTFKIYNQRARKGRNPITGQEINLQAKRVVKFVPGVQLKKAVHTDDEAIL